MQPLDLSGQRFGRLVVDELARVETYTYSRSGRSKPGVSRVKLWRCRCDCGTVVEVMQHLLRAGRSQSCGCLKRDKMTSHGQSYSRVYHIWAGMLQRCTNPNYSRWADWGGRGITVCDPWSVFENFYADMGDPPTKDHTLDRRDNDGPYCKANCRWATRSEQQLNKRPTVA